MKTYFVIIIVISQLMNGSTNFVQDHQNRIDIIEPSIEQEANSIWRTINDITFFESQGYHVTLPKDALIDSLIMKSKDGKSGNDNYSAINNLLVSRLKP